jgi:predicted ferric reductase
VPALMPGLESGFAQQLQVMGLPLVRDTQAYWYMARAGGIVAYLLLWLGALWGVMMSAKLAKGLYVFGLHEFLPILAMIFAALHALVLLGDHYIGFNLVQLAVPFTASYRPLWTGLGTLALYLGVALAASFYTRRWIGRRTWRVLHYATYGVFALALAHGLMAGTDSTTPLVHWMYVATGASLLFVTLMRIFSLSRGQSSKRLDARGV